MSNNVTHNGGVGILGLLGVVFVTLKLTGYIDWSWWWVTLPFWGGFALVLAVLAVIGLVYLVVHALEKWLEHRARQKRKELENGRS